jgi:hypothetical protein
VPPGQLPNSQGIDVSGVCVCVSSSNLPGDNKKVNVFVICKGGCNRVKNLILKIKQRAGDIDHGIVACLACARP